MPIKWFDRYGFGFVVRTAAEPGGPTGIWAREREFEMRNCECSQFPMDWRTFAAVRGA